MISLEKTIEHFLVDRELKGNTNSTVENYRQCLSYFTDFISIDTIVTDITIENLKDYHISLINKERYDNHIFKPNESLKLEKITIQSYIRHLRVFLKFLYDEEYITYDLTKKFRLPKAPKKVIEVLTDDEVNILLGSIKENSELQLRNKCIVALMLDSGLRRNEVITLEYDSLHFMNNYMKIYGKGQKERLVPIGLTTKKLLLKYINYRSLPEFETKRLFIDKHKKPITDNAVKMLFTRLRTKTKITRLHPHILRHTFATNYLINGGDVFSLQQILGHSSLDMVRKYSHLASSYVISNHKRLSPLDEMHRKKYNY